ncbi:MAG: hypothetical protein A3E83_04950 [Gammaproteobacteria bacterium RIFCSPHIGHO2_12_FULL_41_20]|nr:MAG: hypothetical protein A3E83_04950 [Gammaproteobacteria bacterium RIFCSPHIGHO2_12_FULL_41_20]
MADTLALIFARNMFYRRQYQLILGALAISFIIIVILAWILLYLVKYPPTPVYFAADKAGRLIYEEPLTEPIPTQDVLEWAVEAVQATYSYDFINYRAQLQNAQKYFTSYGWIEYMRALTASNNLLALTNRKMVIIAQIAEPPKVVTTGVLGGAHAWKLEMTLLVTYWSPPFSNTSQFYNPLQVSMIIQRQPLLKSYKGLGILQLIGSITASSTTQSG